MKRHIHHYASFVVLAMFLASCGSGGFGSGSSVSVEDEWQLGQQMAAQVAQQMRVGTDPYVTQVGNRLVSQTQYANLPFHFYVVDDPSVNAFAIPGGHIYVNRGLIAQADRANMLAGVLAHEISHVTQRHVIKQAENQQAIGAIGSILLGQNPNALAVLVANIAAGGAMARFSRADEKEADDVGLELMVKAGYDPHGMLDMFQKLLAMDQGGGSGAVARFFQDHPGTQDRINDIRNRIGNRSGGIVDDPAYQTARRRLS